jgi:hypothetical protein
MTSEAWGRTGPQGSSTRAGRERPVRATLGPVSPTFAVELARLLVADARPDAVERRLALEPDAPALDEVLALGERVRRVAAGEQETALALCLLQVLGSGARKGSPRA